VALTPELRVVVSPRRAYAEYGRGGGPSGIRLALRRPALVALIQGSAITMASTHTVAAPVLASVTMCWSIAVVFQIAGALVLIRSAPVPRPAMARAIDLLFLGHAPWSLWLLLFSGATTFAPSAGILRWAALAAMVVPAALTARIVVAFSEAVLRADRRRAIRLTVLHQGLMLGTLALYIAFAIQLWPRVSGLFGA
jgi:hypothetical protein